MNKFYFVLWLKWAIRLTLCSVFLSMAFSLIVTFYIYISQGIPSLSAEVILALSDIVKFWFLIFWSITILISLFRGLKYIFNDCNSGYQLHLYTCQKEFIESVGYGDLVKVWRKYFMLLIWIIGAEMILSLALTYMFSTYASVFEWFDIYVLYLFILIGGYLSFVILSSKCKQIKVVKC